MPKKMSDMFRNALILACALFLFTPVPYCIEAPGSTTNVLGKIDGKNLIAIEGHENHDPGQLLMTTVSLIGRAQYGVPLYQAVYSNFDSKSVVLPLDYVFPKNMTDTQYKEQNNKLMTKSQNSAIVSAYNFLKMKKYPKTQISIENIGGPSAGLMFALGIIDIVKNANLTGGNAIAGTGQIANNGEVQAIGGIDQKIFGAASSGAKFFLAPTSNCPDIEAEHKNIQIISVSTLNDAINSLEKIKENKLDSLPSCKK
ncbi:MAG: Lon protease [Bifidobacteriaceae bacterium]|jgi:PDZ domain-containing protein|nr:Lon protease [Bifidobacteriaceae bacterium]